LPEKIDLHQLPQPQAAINWLPSRPEGVSLMSYAVLMCYIEAGGQPEHRVRLAAGLAGKFNATLIGLSALPIHPPFLIESVVIWQATAADVEEMMATLAAKGDWFRSIAGADNRMLEWRPILDYPADSLTREARSADLVIIGQTSGSVEAHGSLDAAGAILKVGRPVLVVPDGVSSLKAENAVIAWKDTREARRAITDALPFLHEAAQVTVAQICEKGEERAARESLDAVTRYLTRHRIKAEARLLLDGQGPGSARLVKLAREAGADLIVCGAYGHSRLGEWIFGGMTGELLATSPICCLMSH
jgi:nucleotide-binding universal stress UspA family protein